MNGTMMCDGGLAARLSRYAVLTPDEQDALGGLERRDIRLSAGAALLDEGSANDALFVVHSGWLHSSVQLRHGGRQILRFHFAGDLMGTSGIAWLPAVHSLTAVSDCIVADIPKSALARLFREQPRIGGLLYAVAAAENVAICDRLTSAARQGAIERVGMLLLDILARLRVTAAGVVHAFDMPLTQGDIGDAVGLTNVHVNRMFARLERLGYLRRDGRRMTILDEPGLIALTGFVDRHAVVETDWLAAAAA